MLLRKEMKIGLGIGAAVLGIVLVYGIMATLSANSKTPGVASADPSAAVADGGGAAPDATTNGHGGLPPIDEPKSTDKKPDPYSESARRDGNPTDPWTQALQTGKVAMDVQPVSTHKLLGSGQSAGGSSIAEPMGSGFGGATLTGGSQENGPIVTKLPDYSSNPTLENPASRDNSGNAAGSERATASGTYKVEPGDTFSRIAGKLFGDKRMASALQQANPEITPTRLRAGSTIKVPAKDEVATIRGEVARSKARVTGAVDADREYRVAAGDTLSRIAVKLYGRRAMWEAIYDENKSAIGGEPSKLKLGEVLKLPKPPSVATPISR